MTDNPAEPSPSRAPAKPAGPSRSNRTLGMLGQAVGVVGVVLSVALAGGAIMGRGFLVDAVGNVAGVVDSELASVPPLLDKASSAVGAVSGQIASVSNAIGEAAANPGAGSPALDNVLAALNGVSDRYLALRGQYAEARSKVASAIASAQAIAHFVPGVSLPEEPLAKLDQLDQAIRDLDTSIMGVITAIPGPDAGAEALASLSARIDAVNATLATAGQALGQAAAKIDDLRTEVAGIANRISLAITLAMLLVILVAIYVAFLHVLLFRTGTRLKATAG